MGALIKSSVELEEKIRLKTDYALFRTYERLHEKLLDLIEENVYVRSSYDFGRRGSFSDDDTWQIKTYKYGDMRVRLEYMPDNLDYEQLDIYGTNGYSHGNMYGEVMDGEDFLQMMNGKFPSGDFANYPVIQRQPFWDEFLDYYNLNLDSIFKEECSKLGMELSDSINDL